MKSTLLRLHLNVNKQLLQRCVQFYDDVEKIRKKPKTREIRAEKQNRNNLQVIYCDLGFRSAELKKMVYENFFPQKQGLN